MAALGATHDPLRARRIKDKAASKARAVARERAREHVVRVLTALNDQDRDPATRAEAQARRGSLPGPGWDEFHEVREAEEASYAETALRLIRSWDHDLAARLIDEVRVKGVYRLADDGSVELESGVSTGPASAFAALNLAMARDAFRTVNAQRGSFERRVKRCENPSCKKWFFDGERGTRVWCCEACGNAHRQLKRAGRRYKERLKAGEYERRRCPCSRPGCEG